MPPVPAVRGLQLVKALEKAGFELARVRGSHHVMRHADGRTVAGFEEQRNGGWRYRPISTRP